MTIHTPQKPSFQEVQNLSQQIKQELCILFLTIFLLFSTFFASAQTSYPCDKDSIDMATNELWLNELEKLLPQKEQALEYWKQRVLCDTSRKSDRDVKFGCIRIVRLGKQPNHISLYYVNQHLISYQTIHRLLTKLQAQHIISLQVLQKDKAAAIFGTRSYEIGVVMLKIENILKQGEQLILKKYKVNTKKQFIKLHFNNLSAIDSIKIIATRLCSDNNCKGKYSFFHLNNFAIKKGRNKIKIPYFGLPRIYTIYLNGKKEIEFFE
jgi:hypothetical protein